MNIFYNNLHWWTHRELSSIGSPHSTKHFSVLQLIVVILHPQRFSDNFIFTCRRDAKKNPASDNLTVLCLLNTCRQSYGSYSWESEPQSSSCLCYIVYIWSNKFCFHVAIKGAEERILYNMKVLPSSPTWPVSTHPGHRLVSRREHIWRQRAVNSAGGSLHVWMEKKNELFHFINYVRTVISLWDQHHQFLA